MAAEALAATIRKETVNAVSELPPHVLENETLLSDAVHEAFENAAASYFPNSVIKPELRESAERHGMWTRMPEKSERKRYAKYSDTVPVEISPRLASSVDTFGGATLHDHLRDQYGHHDGRPLQGEGLLVPSPLPGTRGSAELLALRVFRPLSYIRLRRMRLWRATGSECQSRCASHFRALSCLVHQKLPRKPATLPHRATNRAPPSRSSCPLGAGYQFIARGDPIMALSQRAALPADLLGSC